ncbi:MAG: hypothetical protein QW717_00740 [Candidatus Bathyarchaeia archaeon]
MAAAGLMEKNPTAVRIHEIHINRKPTKTIESTAPISHSKPAVPNIFSPDFAERLFKDFLKSTAETMRNMKKTM